MIATIPGLADQGVFDLRREQVLQPHGFDVRHYRIALSLDVDSQSFGNEAAITFSSMVDGLQSRTCRTWLPLACGPTHR
jgi:hypothetical protein